MQGTARTTIAHLDPCIPNDALTVPGKLVPSLLPRYPEAAQGMETIMLPTKQASTQRPGLRPREKAELDTCS
jgi:hypothetical protein